MGDENGSGTSSYRSSEPSSYRSMGMTRQFGSADAAIAVSEAVGHESADGVGADGVGVDAAWGEPH
ncbi:MAG: hypothetical protein ACYDAN_16755, partial [Candidatus Limnocylindrales bacterium]